MIPTDLVKKINGTNFLPNKQLSPSQNIAILATKVEKLSELSNEIMRNPSYGISYVKHVNWLKEDFKKINDKYKLKTAHKKELSELKKKIDSLAQKSIVILNATTLYLNENFGLNVGLVKIQTK